MPISNWLISGQPGLSDGQWHRVRFVLFASTIDSSGTPFHSPSSACIHCELGLFAIPSLVELRWWVQLTIDGVHVHSNVIDWAPGDTKRQDILLGAELVHGFRPFAEVFYPKGWMTTAFKEPQDPEWPHFNYSAPPPILRSGFVGESFISVEIHPMERKYKIIHHFLLLIRLYK